MFPTACGSGSHIAYQDLGRGCLRLDDDFVINEKKMPPWRDAARKKEAARDKTISEDNFTESKIERNTNALAKPVIFFPFAIFFIRVILIRKRRKRKYSDVVTLMGPKLSKKKCFYSIPQANQNVGFARVCLIWEQPCHNSSRTAGLPAIFQAFFRNFKKLAQFQVKFYFGHFGPILRSNPSFRKISGKLGHIFPICLCENVMPHKFLKF